MKIAAILAAAASLSAVPATGQARPGESPETGVLHGQCEYADRFAPLLKRGDYSFALCDAAVIQRNGERGTIEFRRESWGVMVAYEGVLSGDGLTVDSVRVRSGAERPATGTCKIFRSHRKVSTVTCAAKAGGKYTVANFVPSRIAP